MTATLPPRVTPDKARTRLTDPLPSHVAADKSSATIRGVKDKVLVLLAEQGPLDGLELNELYEFSIGRRGWPRVSYDSPRKRVAELVEDGLVYVTNPDCKRGQPHIYALVGGGKSG